MKRYTIYRYAYQDTVDQIFVPDETKFFLVQSWGNPKETEYGTVMPNKYLAVVPYDKKVYKIIMNAHQSYNMEIVKLGDKYIFIILNDVYPLSKDFPLTDEAPTIDTVYLKVRGSSQTKNESKFDMDFSGMSEEEIKDVLMPTIYYQKVNGFDVYDYEKINITSIVVGNWLNDLPNYEISRNDERILEALRNTKFIKVEPSTKEEFEEQFNKMIKNF